MRRFKQIILVLFLVLMYMPDAYAQSSNKLDERFVGQFQGQRDMSGKCQFLAWSMTRSEDGRFRVTFYSDPKKLRIMTKEAGTWWIKGSRFYLLTDGVSQPDVYKFRFRDEDTIDLIAIKRDPTVDCTADYNFTDHRVR